MFSKSCQYAIKIMLYLATKSEHNYRTGLTEIAKKIDSPRAFTAKILQQLVRAGLLESLRGKSGGFSISANKNISLGDIVRATDGEEIMTGCVLGLKKCEEEYPCPVHHKFKYIRSQLTSTMNDTNLEEMNDVMEKEMVFLTL